MNKTVKGALRGAGLTILALVGIGTTMFAATIHPVVTLITLFILGGAFIGAINADSTH